MRKSIVPQQGPGMESEQGWLDVGTLARVEITSEDPTHPIESALQGDPGPGWRAAGPGKQSIRLLFDDPLPIRRVYLRFDERERARTQEFVLRASQDNGRNYREIVRQQYNFNPPGTVTEEEEYRVDLSGVTALELEIVPDISGSEARAVLARLRVS